MKYQFLRFIGFIIGLVPSSILYTVAEVIGFFGFIFWKNRRITGFQNLKKAFPEKNHRELKKILKNVFINLSIIIFEIFKQPYVGRNIDKVFNVKGFHNLKKAYSKNKGVILITSHFGNWELAGSLICKKGFNLDVIQKKQNNLDFDKVLNHYRQINGMKPIDRKIGLRKGVQALKKGEILALLVDQKAKIGGVEAEFFDHNASTTPLPAKLYQKYKSPIVFMYSKRIGTLKFEVNFYELYQPENEDIMEITQYINNSIENYIRETPEQWLWVHNRW
ncbi:MAG: lysophospholipid acyltransferase family protein [Candidatus Muiribacteriota bacterium]